MVTKTPITLPSTSSLEVPESPLHSSSSEKEAKETSISDQLLVAKFGLKRELQCLMQAKSKTSEQPR